MHGNTRAALARAITTTNGTCWVIPGDGYVCIAVPDPVDGYGTSCVPTAVALTRGIYLALGGDGPRAVVSETLVVPDGAVAVQATPGASPAAVEPKDGVVSLFGAGDGALHVAP